MDTHRERSQTKAGNQQLTRRQLLGRAGLIGVAGVLGSSGFLQACAPQAQPAATGTALATAAPTVSAAPRAIDRVRVATALAIPHLNSLEGNLGGTVAHHLMQHIYSGLFMINPVTQKVEPALAESHDFSADGLSMRVKLRKGVKFHDGNELTSQDVSFSINRKLDPANPAPLTLDFSGWVKNAVAVDPYTVDIALKFPQRSQYEGRLNLAIYSKAHYDKVGTKGLQDKPVGTGPYRVTDFQVNTKMTLEAFRDFWGPKPLASTIDVRFVTDDNARMNLLKSGDVDLVDQVPIEAAKELRDRFDLFSAPAGAATHVRLGSRYLTSGPLKDVRVRQALNYAVDRQTIHKQIYDGTGDVMPGLLTRASGAFDSSLKPYAFDPAKARSLLAEAGHSKGVQLELIYPLGRYIQATEMLTAVSGYLKDVGVEVILKPVDVATWNQRLNATKAEASAPFIMGGSLWNWDPLVTLQQVLPSSAPPSGNVDPELDEQLLKAIPAISDAKARTAAIQRAEKVAFDKAYYLFLIELPQIYAAKKNIAWTVSPIYWTWSGWLMAGK